MAKYDVEYSCGHSGEVVLFGPGKERERKLEWYHNSASCPDCYQKEKDEAKRIQNAEAAKSNTEMSLPKLTGSEKQIAWANTIRIDRIKRIDELINKGESIQNKTRIGEQEINLSPAEYDQYLKPIHETVKDLRNKLLTHTSASWWIDQRSTPLNIIYKETEPDLFEKHNKLNQVAKEYLLNRDKASKAQSSVAPGVTAGGSETSKDKPVEPEPYVSSKPSKPRIKVTMPEIRKIQSGRSEKSQIADSAFTSKHLILPKQRNRLFRWKNHPERWDVQNIDTKGSRRKTHPYKGIIKHKR
jgi:hypothetical protein